MHHRQVVVLVEDLYERFPVTVDIELAGARAAPARQIPGLVKGVEIAKPLVQRRPGFVEAHPGKAGTFGQDKFNQTVFRRIEIDRVLHSRVDLEAAVQVIGPPVKRALELFAIAVTIDDAAATMTATVGKGFQLAVPVANHDNRFTGNIERGVIAGFRPPIGSTQANPALQKQCPTLEWQQRIVRVAARRDTG